MPCGLIRFGWAGRPPVSFETAGSGFRVRPCGFTFCPVCHAGEDLHHVPKKLVLRRPSDLCEVSLRLLDFSFRRGRGFSSASFRLRLRKDLPGSCLPRVRFVPAGGDQREAVLCGAVFFSGILREFRIMFRKNPVPNSVGLATKASYQR